MSEQELALDNLPGRNSSADGASLEQAGGQTHVGGPGAKKRGRLQIPGAGGVVMVGVFLAVIVGLYLLSLGNRPAEASAEQRLVEARVDSARLELDQVTGPDRAGRGKKLSVVERFYHDSQSRQIPVGDLQGNPFVFKAPPRMRKAAVAGLPGRPKPKKPAASPQWKQAGDAARQMRLQSILSGTHGAVAVISNNLLTEGQKIHGWTVTQIRPRSVTLKWNDRTFVLEMPE